jgi:splicing factor 3A subunit 3
MDCTDGLKDLYEDKDGQRKEEIQSLSGPNEFTEFYNRLKSIREFYRKHPGEVSVPMSLEFEEYTKMRESNNEDFINLVEFKDEEGYGKYLDLHEHYEKYLNLKGAERVDYISYLGTFDRLFDIPKERKGFEYRKYIDNLLEYLYDFLTRIKPLTDFDTILADVQKEFLPQWENGQFPGWPVSRCKRSLYLYLTLILMIHNNIHLFLERDSYWSLSPHWSSS